MVVGVVLVAELGVAHLSPGNIMDSGKTFGYRLDQLFLREVNVNVQFKVMLGVEPMVENTAINRKEIPYTKSCPPVTNHT